MAIRVLPQPAPDLTDIASLAFTSANGVAAFAALTERRDRPVFTVGGATAEAARDAGFPDVSCADGAVADLAHLLDDAAPEGLALCPCALEPAGDLAALTRRTPVRTLPVYETVETGARPPNAVDAVLLQSPRAARALARLWPTLALKQVVAQSPAIAEPIRALTTPLIARHPTETALLEALGNPPPAV